MRISHEAIHQALYVQGRDVLKRELVACLRTGPALRVPRARTRQRPGGHVTPEVMNCERPAAAADRAVCGSCTGTPPSITADIVHLAAGLAVLAATCTAVPVLSTGVIAALLITKPLSLPGVVLPGRPDTGRLPRRAPGWPARSLRCGRSNTDIGRVGYPGFTAPTNRLPASPGFKALFAQLLEIPSVVHRPEPR
jgi:hypothetical protein